MECTNVEDIPLAVEALRKAFKTGVTRPLEWRRRQLRSLRRMVEENQGAICAALDEDMKKPRVEVMAYEVWDVLGQVRFMDENLESLARKEKIPTPFHQKPLSFEARKEPYGVVTIIAPWNFPFMLLLGPLAGALAAGNVCVLKPSEIAPASGRLVAELLSKYFKASEVTVINGGVEQTTALLAEKVDSILFTGGSQVGRIVMAAAAKNLTPVTLELGGKSPVYIDQSANIEVAARRICFAKNVNSGQMCVAPDYAMVHEKVFDSFVAHLKTEHDRLYPGDKQKNKSKGRMVNERHFKRAEGLLDGHGGKVALGGKTAPEERYVDFTVITDPSPDSALMQEEIFAPILPVMKVQSVDEAVEFCRDRPVPLAAYLFQRDHAVREKWLEEVSAGGICVNDCVYQTLSHHGGFAGRGESGMGRTRGKASFDSFTYRKVVGYQLPNFDPLFKYPPFEGLPTTIKFFVVGELPVWVKLAYKGVAGIAIAWVAFFLSKHVSISFH